MWLVGPDAGLLLIPQAAAPRLPSAGRPARNETHWMGALVFMPMICYPSPQGKMLQYPGAIELTFE